MSIINVSGLTKVFFINKRPPGLRGLAKNIFHPEYIEKRAVDGINFNIKKGEIIGFIGPNGAGKSTTIKILTGILVPTGGHVEVNGIVPYKSRIENSKRIGVVFGQKTQLWWNLPVIDSFDLLKSIYCIPEAIYRKNLAIFSDILEIDKFIHVPVRQLSLGQRMRVEIAASLLHNPAIVYLDEPTIGLDIIAKERIREFISEINRESGVTVILTTHDMSDIEKLCKRVIIIDKGRIIIDGNIDSIKERYGQERTLILDFDSRPDLEGIPRSRVIKTQGQRIHLAFNKNEVSAIELINFLSTRNEIRDFSLKETEIDSMIKRIYEGYEIASRSVKYEVNQKNIIL